MEVNFSLEVFPPQELQSSFMQKMDVFTEYCPDFISITCGAGGAGRTMVSEVAKNILVKNNSANVAAHMVCFGLNERLLNVQLQEYIKIGIKHIVALRGDNVKAKGGYQHASELVSLIRRQNTNLQISVAGYPETHPESANSEQDIYYLKKKVDCGADRVLTQFFFSNESFLRFRDKSYKIGIKVPIVPGILPIVNFEKMLVFAKKCQTKVPKSLETLLGSSQLNREEHDKLAFSFLIKQIENLNKEGVEDFHIYTLNQTSMLRLLMRWFS